MQRLRLFPGLLASSSPSGRPQPTLATREVWVLLDLEVDGASTPPTGHAVLSNGVRVHVWDIAQLDGELLIGPIPQPETEMRGQTEIEGALLRVRSKVDLSNLRWRARATSGGWSPETGQYLQALTADFGDYRVSLGTEDDEMLGHRASRGKFLPESWHSSLQDWDSLSRFEPSGLTFNICHSDLRTLHPGQVVQFHLLLARSLRTGDDDVTTWLAVDLASERVIEALVP